MQKPIEEIPIISPVVTESVSDVKTLIKKGDEAYKQNKLDEAIDFYTKAVIFNPSDKFVMQKIANIYKIQEIIQRL